MVKDHVQGEHSFHLYCMWEFIQDNQKVKAFQDDDIIIAHFALVICKNRVQKFTFIASFLIIRLFK